MVFGGLLAGLVAFVGGVFLGQALGLEGDAMGWVGIVAFFAAASLAVAKLVPREDHGPSIGLLRDSSEPPYRTDDTPPGTPDEAVESAPSDPAVERLAALRRAIAEPPAKASSGLLLSGLFLGWIYYVQGSIRAAAVAIAVLAFHELGHFVAMRASGYTDVRIFFLPGFGAATVGRRRRAPLWKEGLVLLAGPLPGLLLGLALPAGAPGSLSAEVRAQLVLINALNLLPIAGLDGGRLVQMVLFSKARRLEWVFVVGTAGLLAYLAVRAGLYGFLVVAAFALVSGLGQRRFARVVDAVRTSRRGRPLPEVDQLSDGDLALLSTSLQDHGYARGPLFAPMVADLADRASVGPLGLAVAVALVVAQIVGIAAAVAGMASLAPT